MYQGIALHTGLAAAGNMAVQAAGKEKEKSSLKVSGIKDAGEENSRDTILNISKEARQKYVARAGSGKSVKKAGTTSAREMFENKAARWKQNVRSRPGDNLGPDVYEMLRLDEPETYEKMIGYYHQAWEARYEKGMEEEARAYSLKAEDVQTEWYYRRCYDKDFWSLAGYTVLDTLDSLYSDAVHDTSFNVYTGDGSDGRSSLWRYDSKFNVLLPADMLKDLASVKNMAGETEEAEEKTETRREQMEKIDHAVNEMKKAELDYEGDLEYLRFGVKFWEDGRVTYHANYKGCENKDGIMADSAQELLEKLMAA